MRTRLTGLVGVGLACALAGCGATTRSVAPEAGDQGARREAAKRAREVVQEGYNALRRGDVDGMHILLGADIFAVGPGASDVFSGRTDLVVALSAGLPRKKHRVTSRALTVVSSPAARSAWAADRIDIDGVTYRMTALLSERDDLWVVDAILLSRPAEKGSAEARAPLPAVVGPGADDLATLFRASTVTPAKLLDQLADSKDAIAISSAAQPPTKGAKAIRKLWRKAFDPPPKLDLEGGVRAGLGVDATLGFACATVGVEEDPGKSVGQRFFFVYERQTVGWKLIAVHRSVIR